MGKKVMNKEIFSTLLKQFSSSLEAYVASPDGQWTIKGFIDVCKNIYTISPDTKVVSKILELHIFPMLVKFAEQNGFNVELASCQMLWRKHCLPIFPDSLPLLFVLPNSKC